jgi:hypothetical protein
MLNCIYCASNNDDDSFFCYLCAKQIKCRHCENKLKLDAKACTNCGKLLSENLDIKIENDNLNHPSSLNTVELHETEKSRTIKATFTNEVGNNISNVIGQFLTTKYGEKPNLYQINNLKEISPPPPLDNLNIEREQIINNQKIIFNNFPVNDNLNRINDVLRFSDNECHLIENRLQATSKIDYAKRLTYLFLLAKELNGTTKVSKAELYLILKKENVYDNHFRKWFTKNPEFIIEDKTVELRKQGREQAFKYLEELEAKSNENEWLPTGTNQNIKSKKKQKIPDGTEQELNENGNNSSSKKREKYTIISELNLYPENGPELNEFFTKYKTKSSREINLIFIYYLKKIINVENVNANHIYTCYKHVNVSHPLIKQSLIDTKYSKGWIDTSDMNNIVLTTIGENYFINKIGKPNQVSE